MVFAKLLCAITDVFCFKRTPSICHVKKPLLISKWGQCTEGRCKKLTNIRVKCSTYITFQHVLSKSELKNRKKRSLLDNSSVMTFPRQTYHVTEANDIKAIHATYIYSCRGVGWKITLYIYTYLQTVYYLCMGHTA
jgi:hypothetical protein